MTNTPATDLTDLVDQIKEQRDHLRVRLHLARSEARDEWASLEKRWEHLHARLKVVGHEAGHTAGEVRSALTLVAAEIKEGYQRLRALM